MDLELAGELTVVVGAAAGIGQAIALRFAQEGCPLVLLDRNPRIANVAGELAPVAGAMVIAHECDVADWSDMQQLGERITAEHGVPRHVVFAAGVGSGKFGGPFWKVPPADWQRVLAVNLLGAMHTAQAFAPAMAQERQGTLLFLSSVAGQIGSPTDPPYSAAKAGAINFAQCAAKDLAPHGVRVNTICPGMVQTDLCRSVWQAWNEQQQPESQQSFEDWGQEKVDRLVPLRRWQSPDDIAALAVFLASPRAANITGQTMNVDGGYVMHW